MIKTTLCWGLFLISLYISDPGATIAQFRDTVARGDTLHITHEQRSGQRDSLPGLRDLAVQFIAGEVAFNATFFGLAGSSFAHPANPNSAFNGQAVLGLLSSIITIPLAQYLASNLLQLRSGSWPLGMAGALLGAFPVGFLLYPVGHPAFGTINLALGLPMVALAELFYDLTIPTR